MVTVPGLMIKLELMIIVLGLMTEMDLMITLQLMTVLGQREWLLD